MREESFCELKKPNFPLIINGKLGFSLFIYPVDYFSLLNKRESNSPVMANKKATKKAVFTPVKKFNEYVVSDPALALVIKEIINVKPIDPRIGEQY
ncbi:hypothetical protein KFZ58_11590 [Virgibacillus sp. NKC19-16]|uniref:hypothetical protein n=1 Tax=Virgibacillus salidurans TaxID=2831673 RepID=UPI001F16E41A|nr:hypothetical protein [Virgibacillus sp. NKC19-16]UJL45061.1 hypothetical protein KFZ58_11590 [Virgibacillus sp. NKC19-16]